MSTKIFQLNMSVARISFSMQTATWVTLNDYALVKCTGGFNNSQKICQFSIIKYA